MPHAEALALHENVRRTGRRCSEHARNQVITTSNLHAELRFRNSLSHRKVGIRFGTESRAAAGLSPPPSCPHAKTKKQSSKFLRKTTNAMAGAVARTVTVTW